MIKTNVIYTETVEFPAAQTFYLPMCTVLNIEPASVPAPGCTHASVEVSFGNGASKYFMNAEALRAWANTFNEIAAVMEDAVAAMQ